MTDDRSRYVIEYRAGESWPWQVCHRSGRWPVARFLGEAGAVLWAARLEAQA